MARFVADREGIARMARSEDMQRALKIRADRAADFARQIAPVRTGRYRASFRTSAGVGPNGRAYARLENTVHYSVYLEFGTRYMKRQRILGRSIDAMRG
jgi:HK97 gp10 family phage protein